jgi:hypothetical protein
MMPTEPVALFHLDLPELPKQQLWKTFVARIGFCGFAVSAMSFAIHFSLGAALCTLVMLMALSLATLISGDKSGGWSGPG